MGLLDIINGMESGSRGEGQPGSSGMSPLAAALLGVLAHKAAASSGGASPTADPNAAAPAENPTGGLGGMLGHLFGGAGAGANPAGAGAAGLGDALPLGLDDLLRGGAAGGVVSRGLDTLVRELQDSGYGHAVQSWIGTGPNEQIAPGDLANALGRKTVDALSRQTGMSSADLTAALSRHLPELINRLTPGGRLPTEDEASRMV